VASDPKRLPVGSLDRAGAVIHDDIWIRSGKHPIDPRGRESCASAFIHGEIYKARARRERGRPQSLSVGGAFQRYNDRDAPFSHGPVLSERAFRTSKSATQKKARICWSRRHISDKLSPSPWQEPGGAHARARLGHRGRDPAARSGAQHLSGDQRRMQLQAIAIAGTEGKITYLDKGEIRASVPAQDYGRAWPIGARRRSPA